MEGGDYTPKPDLNNAANLSPELQAELDAFKAGLLDVVSDTVVSHNAGDTPLDDARADAEEPSR